MSLSIGITGLAQAGKSTLFQSLTSMSRPDSSGKRLPLARVPVPDDRLGERGCLAVSGTIEPDELMRHLREQGLSKYDMPEYFIRVEEFPLTASGKILKRELTQLVRRGELVPSPIRCQAAAAT